MVKLGEKVKDSITGFRGVAVAKCEYLNGCISIQVQPEEMKDGLPIKAQWFDEQQLGKSKATAGGSQSLPPELHP